jgi:hypothetical protein
LAALGATERQAALADHQLLTVAVVAVMLTTPAQAALRVLAVVAQVARAIPQMELSAP